MFAPVGVLTTVIGEVPEPLLSKAVFRSVAWVWMTLGLVEVTRVTVALTGVATPALTDAATPAPAVDVALGRRSVVRMLGAPPPPERVCGTGWLGVVGGVGSPPPPAFAVKSTELVQ